MFSEWEKVLANPTAATAINKMAYHSVILEFKVKLEDDNYTRP